MQSGGFANAAGLFQENRAGKSGMCSHGFILHTGDGVRRPVSDCGIFLPWDLERSVRSESCGAYWYGVLAHDVIFLSCHLLHCTSEEDKCKQVVVEVTEFIENASASTPRTISTLSSVVTGMSRFLGITMKLRARMFSHLSSLTQLISSVRCSAGCRRRAPGLWTLLGRTRAVLLGRSFGHGGLGDY